MSISVTIENKIYSSPLDLIRGKTSLNFDINDLVISRLSSQSSNKGKGVSSMVIGAFVPYVTIFIVVIVVWSTHI